MSQDFSPAHLLLRLIAFLGTGVVLLWGVVSMPQLQPRQSAGFIVLALAVLAVGFMLLILSDALQTLLKYIDLLVPLGLFLTVTTIFSILATVPALAAILFAPWPIKLLTFSLSISGFASELTFASKLVSLPQKSDQFDYVLS